MKHAKTERSGAKRGVTIAATQLIGSCSRSAPADVVTAKAVALESAVDDFLAKQEVVKEIVNNVLDDNNIDDERLKVLNGEDPEKLETYKEEVMAKYNEA